MQQKTYKNLCLSLFTTDIDVNQYTGYMFSCLDFQKFKLDIKKVPMWTLNIIWQMIALKKSDKSLHCATRIIGKRWKFKVV